MLSSLLLQSFIAVQAFANLHLWGACDRGHEVLPLVRKHRSG